MEASSQHNAPAVFTTARTNRTGGRVDLKNRSVHGDMKRQIPTVQHGIQSQPATPWITFAEESRWGNGRSSSCISNEDTPTHGASLVTATTWPFCLSVRHQNSIALPPVVRLVRNKFHGSWRGLLAIGRNDLWHYHCAWHDGSESSPGAHWSDRNQGAMLQK